MSQLRAFTIAIGFIILTLPLMPVQWLLLHSNSRLSRWLPQHYHRLVCGLLGIHIEVKGTIAGAGLLVANHTSWLDIPILSTVAPLSFIAKKEVDHWPFFGTLARLQNSYFIDRSRRLQTGTARAALVARLDAGETLVLFPEGTSGPGHRVKPFKSALFGSIENSTIPVFPVAIIYTAQHGLPLTLRQRPQVAWYGAMDLLPHLWQVLKAGPIKVQIIVLPTLFSSNFANRKTLAEAAESQISVQLCKRLHPAAKIG